MVVVVVVVVVVLLLLLLLLLLLSGVAAFTSECLPCSSGTSLDAIFLVLLKTPKIAPSAIARAFFSLRTGWRGLVFGGKICQVVVVVLLPLTPYSHLDEPRSIARKVERGSVPPQWHSVVLRRSEGKVLLVLTRRSSLTRNCPGVMRLSFFLADPPFLGRVSDALRDQGLRQSLSIS